VNEEGLVVIVDECRRVRAFRDEIDLIVDADAERIQPLRVFRLLGGTNLNNRVPPVLVSVARET
jgi:hypothetical protein